MSAVSGDEKSDREKSRMIRVRQRAIGRELRRMYDGVAKEPIPEEFLTLLRKIDERDDHEESPEDR